MDGVRVVKHLDYGTNHVNADVSITILEARGNNYVYLCTERGRALVVDPGDAALVLRALREKGLTLSTILLTHRHADHTAGCAELRRTTGCAVVGPNECGTVGLNRTVVDNERLMLDAWSFDVLAVPGHTNGHVAYSLPDKSAVFTGDTLFAGGCGRLFEGTAEQMWRSLTRLRDLPPDTAVYPGHDYTEDNLEFAAELLPGDAAVAARLEQVRELAAAGHPTVPSTIEQERATNVFLRADSVELANALGMRGAEPVTVFAELRRRKDRW